MDGGSTQDGISTIQELQQLCVLMNRLLRDTSSEEPALQRSSPVGPQLRSSIKIMTMLRAEAHQSRDSSSCPVLRA